MSIPLMYQEDVAETFTVKRAERIWIPYLKIISYLCHLSKNVWNQSQHIVYGEYKKYGHVPSYEDVDAMLNKKSYYNNKYGKYNPEFDNYHKLYAAMSQQIIKVHNKAWKGFLVEIKDYWTNLKKKKIDQKDYTGMPKEPGYKNKDGEFILIFTNQQIKFKENKDGSVWMIFPDDIKDDNGNRLKIKLGNIRDKEKEGEKERQKGGSYLIERLMLGKLDQVRIIPAGTGYWIDTVYDKEVIKDNSRYGFDPNIIISIDLGVENLATITDNIGNRPIIIKGSDIKCVNQWYNKKKAELQAIYDRNMVGKACLIKLDKKEKNNAVYTTKVRSADQLKLTAVDKHVKKSLDKYGRIKYLTVKTGKKLDIITDNRNKKVMDEFHRLSKGIIKHALSIKAGIIAIGKNPGWKIKIKMGKRNNQNFVNIPFTKLIDLVRYKAGEYGIIVKDPIEEYTSKCSFLDSEEICYHNKYMGKRVYRGLFRSSKGILVKKNVTSNKMLSIGKERLINEINADVQGSYNILRKVSPKFNVYDILRQYSAKAEYWPIEGVAVHGLVPVRLNVSDLLDE